MDESLRTFAIANPNGFDGDPFEVADRAVRQAGAVAGVLREALDGAVPMIANAEMERQIYKDGEADYPAFAASPLGRKFDALIEQARTIEKSCEILARAARFDPKHPETE